MSFSFLEAFFLCRSYLGFFVAFLIYFGVTVFYDDVKAQNNEIINIQETHQYSIKSSIKTPNYETLRNLFDRFARGNNCYPSSVSHNVYYNYYASLVRNNKEFYKINVYIDSIRSSSPLFYRNYDVSAFFIPDLVDIRISLFITNGTLYKSWEKKHVDFAGKVVIVDTSLRTKADLEGAKLSIISLVLYFSKNRDKLFEGAANYIDSYYASSDIIRKLENQLNGIDVRNLDNILVNDMLFCDIETALNELLSKEYPMKLRLNEYDAINFMVDLEKFMKSYIYKRNIHDSLIINIDRILYDRALLCMRNKDTVKAEEYLKQSLKYNYLFYPSHFSMIEIFLKSRQLEKAREYITEIKELISYSGYFKKRFVDIAQQVYLNFLFNARKYIKNSDYNEAIVELERAKKMCEEVEFVTCTEELENSLKESHYGLYNAYLNVARMAIKNNKIELAEKYVSYAKKYQQENSKYIVSSIEAEDLLQGVYAKYLAEAEKCLNEGKYDEALKHYDDVIEYCKKYNAKPTERVFKGIKMAKNKKYQYLIDLAKNALKNDAPQLAENYAFQAKQYQLENSEIEETSEIDSLLVKMKEGFYKNYIVNGKKYLENRDYLRAYNFFKQAKDIEDKFLVSKDVSLEQLLVSSGEYFVNKMIEDVRFKIWANELDTAREILNRTIDEYEFCCDKSNNIKYSNIFDSLDRAIKEKECYNLKAKQQNLIYFSYQDMKQKNFFDAYLKLNVACDIKSKYYDCKLDTSIINLIKDSIGDAYKYQYLLRLSHDLKIKGDYKGMIEKYEEAEKYYYNNNVGKFDIVHINVYNFVASLCEREIIFKVINYYNKKNEPEKSLKIFQLLAEKNSSLYYFHKKMRKTGKLLALKYRTDSDNMMNVYILSIFSEKKLETIKRAYNRTKALGRLNFLD